MSAISLPSSDKENFLMAESRINSGEINITFDDDNLVLKPTLQAATAINRQFDGFANARAALVRESFDAVVFILRVGLNLNNRDARDLPERVYKNGITAELLIPLIEYVAVLGNGGRPVNLNETTSDQGEDNNPNG